MLPEPLEPTIQILQCLFNTDFLAGLRISQVIYLPTLSRGTDLLLGSWSADLVVGPEGCFDGLCAFCGRFVECPCWHSGTQLCEGVREDQSVFETLSGACTLMWCAGVSDIAKEADQGVVVGGGVGVVENRPSSGLDGLAGNQFRSHRGVL